MERERERQTQREREKEREWDREKERVPNRLHAVSAESSVGLGLMNCENMT